ncbi:MAG: MBL fold metallo-hydrolase [Alphaproteobacteria bacterium]|nr:MBL fold metallo-hydrolase [Alphaproteobacteria bacterium]
MMEVTFHGVRGSWPQSGPDYVIGGHTVCVEVKVGGHTLVFDAGTGMARLSEKLSKELSESSLGREKPQIHLFLSHYHVDHIMGLPLFEPLFTQNAHIILHAPILENRDPYTIFNNLIRPPLYPFTLDLIAPALTFKPFVVGDIILIEDMKIETIFLHHPGASCGYRVHHTKKSLCYLTDVGIKEGDLTYPKELKDFVRDTDLLIQDAYFSQEDFEHFSFFGHGSVVRVAHLAKESNVKRLALYHHNPRYTDAYLYALEKETLTLFPEAFLAKEGEVMRL